ncbi:guanine nucleotide-binding subunit alpha-12 isoform X2 [Labeo rohita]|uniref:Guanine nucleotide-binding subunit alpha-12 isoform X2 n=1 Tax=Labeo rohita TaxID=84645 RepID=A0A498NPN4_LABRO|nr:guanine nucleotide-binding subunit alpha-12 isoform X2 [Labeo rohita]
MSASSEPINHSVCPKRHPAYLQDYEVDLQSFRISVSPVVTREQAVESSDDDFSSSQVGASAAKPKRAHSLPTFSPSSRLTVRHKHCDLPSSLQQHISKPTHQSPSQYPNRELQPESNAECIPLGDEGDGYQSDRSDASSLKLQRITEENLKLHETQQVIQADLKCVEAAKEKLIQLLDRACSLQRHSSTPTIWSDHPSVSFHDAAYAGDEGWPEPPPPIAYDEPGAMSQCCKQELYSSTRATPTFTPRLTSVENTRDSSHPCPYEGPLRFGQYLSARVYPEQHRRAPYNVLTPMASVDLTERYYKCPCPTIPYFCTRDPSEFARLKIALDNLLPPDSTEMFKYQVLVDHLKLDDACLTADSFLHSPTPNRDTMLALNERFGQPHQVALRRIATILDSPDISHNDPSAFEKFSLQVQSLVGLFKTLGQAFAGSYQPVGATTQAKTVSPHIHSPLATQNCSRM